MGLKFILIPHSGTFCVTLEDQLPPIVAQD
jgi:hypothetical protein